MKRVYTDERFPGMEVQNDGTAQFRVMMDGQEHESFTTYQPAGGGMLSEEDAQRRAQSYFDRMAHGQMSDELHDRSIPAQGAAPATKRVQIPADDDTAVFNNPPPARGTVDLGPTVDANAVIDLYKRARGTADPEERERLMQQVKSMSNQLESMTEADELINRLLD